MAVTVPNRLDASKIRERWDKSVKATRVEREQAAVNAMFLRNKQWVYWNRGSGRLEELPRSPSRVRATVPRIGPDSRRILAKLLRRELQFDVPPTTPDDAAIRGARIAESALSDAQKRMDWETLRAEHANCVWEAGVGALCVEWDWQTGETVGMNQVGQEVRTGDVRVSPVSLHELACEPGTRDLEHAQWWMRGVALPPPEVREMFKLSADPDADARAVDMIWRVTDANSVTNIPLTMVFTCWERPSNTSPGGVVTVVNDRVVDQGDWPFPFTDRLNLAVAVASPIHGRWYGHTPVSDAVGVQAIYNASWSSIVEHMKLAGNARLWCPQGSVDDLEELTDTPGEAVEYNPINGMRPVYESPPTMPDWWIRMPAMLEDAMDDILSVHDISRGEAPAGVESGVALSILAEADDTPVGALAKALGECWGRAASMVIKLWETNVKETRKATVRYPSGIPEVINWTGGDLVGQTTAIVPIDAVMPRSRAAQAAWALQLYDRQIIQTPAELAKVADLPDQDDLIAGIDPDTARAQRENYWLCIGEARTVDETDDHNNHLKIHRDFVRSERYEYLEQEAQDLIREHMQAHEMYAAQQAAQQTQAASVSPIAAVLPTAQTKPVPAETMAEATGMSQMAPAAGTGEMPPQMPSPQDLSQTERDELSMIEQNGGQPPQMPQGPMQ